MWKEQYHTTVHPWYDGHSTSISVCGVWGARVRVQVFKRKLHTHIHLGCVWIDFKLIPKMIFRKMGCLVVTSNSIKLKSISSWPKMRAKTTENHFRFHFHFKWFPTLENRRERERESERKREREKERRDRDITGTTPSADTTPIDALHNHDHAMSRSRSIAISPSHQSQSREVSGFDDFFLGFVCVLRNEWYYIFV